MALPTPNDLRWARRASELEFTQLATMRANAEKWRNGLIALTAALSAGFVVASPKVADDLDGRDLAVVLTLQAVALLLLGTATWLAMVASFGKAVSLPPGGSALRESEAKDVARARRDIRFARYLTVIGLVLLLLGVLLGIRWKAAPPSYLQVSSATDKYCGTFAVSKDGTKISITGRDGHVTDVAVDALTTVEFPKSC